MNGFTLMEALVGVVAGAIIAMVSAAVIRAGVLAYRYSAFENQTLDATRKALDGDGSRRGLVATAQGSAYVTGLLASSVTFVSSGTGQGFYLASSSLYRSSGTASAAQAGPVSGVSFSYYSMNASGLIVQATAAASATLITALVTSPGLSVSSGGFSGAQLRNHP